MVEQLVRRSNRYEILTPTGFKSFDGIVRSKKHGIRFTTNIGTIDTSVDHIFVVNDEYIPAYKASIGTELSKIEYIVKIEPLEELYLYDPLNVEGGNKYFGNDIVHHNCQFLGSTNTLINADTISRLSPKAYEYTKDNLDIIEEPKPQHAYFITVDTSRGVGGDYSAFTVIDTTEYPFTVVAKYRDNKISPLLYPDIIHKVARDYHNAFVLVEINDIGQQIADILHNDLEYENMIWVGSDPRYGQHLSSSGKSAVLGVRTTKQIKRIGCASFKSLVENNKLLIFDKDIISEISTFVEKSGSFEADEGYNDDLVMSLVLFSWASNDPMFKDLMNTNNRQALFSQQMKNIEEELTPFGFINDGVDRDDLLEISGGDLWLSDKYHTNLQDFIKQKTWG